MNSIKTSKHVGHFCRLHSNGALHGKCENQCACCNSEEMEFNLILDRVRTINEKLTQKGFDINGIEKFWDEILVLAPTIIKNGIDNIKVCTGCGHLNIETLKPDGLDCCPEPNYINIKK